MIIMNEYEPEYTKTRKQRMAKRKRAILKLSNGKDPQCSICGCPHAEILHIGHPDHDGSWHKRSLSTTRDKRGSRNIVKWVLETDIDEVLKRVQLECPYCNAWHNRFKEYPEGDKQPKWSKESDQLYIKGDEWSKEK